MCKMWGERRETVERAGSDKLVSLILRELEKCKPTKLNNKCTKQNNQMSTIIMQYTWKKIQRKVTKK